MLFSSQACAPVDSITRPVEGRLTTQYAALVFVFLAFSLAAPAATAQESIVWGNSAGPWASGPSTVSNGSRPETWHDVSNTFTLEGTTTPRRLSIMFTGTGSARPPPDSPLPWAGTAEVSVGGVAFLDDGSGEVAVWSHSDAFGPPAESTEPIGGLDRTDDPTCPRAAGHHLHPQSHEYGSPELLRHRLLLDRTHLGGVVRPAPCRHGRHREQRWYGLGERVHRSAERAVDRGRGGRGVGRGRHVFAGRGSRRLGHVCCSQRRRAVWRILRLGKYPLRA